MTIRVIQWSTGNVGRYALRAIINHPELELVGLFVSSPAKEGKDAGELCGVDPVGVHATRDIDALLSLDAEAVCYTADAGMRPGDAIEDMAKILASGKNVVSCSMVGLVHPTTLNDMFTKRLTDALIVDTNVTGEFVQCEAIHKTKHPGTWRHFVASRARDRDARAVRLLGRQARGRDRSDEGREL